MVDRRHRVGLFGLAVAFAVVLALIAFTPQATAAAPEWIGVVRDGVWYFRTSPTAGTTQVQFSYGDKGDVPVFGDWNGDGVKTAGVFRDGQWFLRNSNTTGAHDLHFWYGDLGDVPIVGDWNGDGVDTIGVYRNGSVYLRNSNSNGGTNLQFSYGNPGDLPLAGDWNGDGIDTIGVFRSGQVFLRNSNSTGGSNISFWFGDVGDSPLAGDWNGDGIDSVGVFRAGQFILRDSNSNGAPNYNFGYGNPNDFPVHSPLYVPRPAPVPTSAVSPYNHPIHGLVNLTRVNGFTVNSSIATNFRNLLNAAMAAGHKLGGSGWRSYENQVELRIRHCGGNTYYNIYQKPSSQCSPPTATPGNSLHERGLAIDFNVSGVLMKSGTPAFNWLKTYAASYGLYNLPSEPWHWSTTGN